MRSVLLVAVLALASGTAAGAAKNPQAPYRPSPRVLEDPPGYYSPALFAPKGKPQPGDWMAEHPEPPQSFTMYLASRPARPTIARHTLVLASVGPMADKDRQRLGVLGEFLELFYTLPVRMGPTLSLQGVASRKRSLAGRTFRQYLTGDILMKVLKPALPPDAMGLMGVTMEDLYPDASWNFVFGQALLEGRVGIYSLVRFYPAFLGQKETADAEQKGLVRSLHLLAHETGHTFGVSHCQTHLCVMNGSNSLAEADTQPLHLCPECLKKFRWNIGFDMIARYESLRKFYEAHGIKDEAAWVAKRIAECKGPKTAAEAPSKKPPQEGAAAATPIP